MNVEKKCPACAEYIKSEARVCRHCGYQYSQAQMAEQRKQEREIYEAITAGLGAIVLALLAYAIYNLSGCGDKTEQSQPTLETSDSDIIEQQAEDSELSATAPDVGLDPVKKQEYGEMIATAINLNGHLCAKVTRVQPLKVNDSTFEVTCIEYRGGSGTVRYIVNTDTGVAYKQ